MGHFLNSAEMQLDRIPTLISSINHDTSNENHINASNILELSDIHKNVIRGIQWAKTHIDHAQRNNDEDNAEKTRICSAKLCMQEAASEFPFNAQDIKKIEFNTDEDFSFMGTETQVKICVYNLIRNALRAISKKNNGHIEIKVIAKNRSITIRDTGCGIKTDHRPYIFNKGFSTKPYNGGNGLYICMNLLKKINATINCRSKEGEFTLMEIVFPEV